MHQLIQFLFKQHHNVLNQVVLNAALRLPMTMAMPQSFAHSDQDNNFDNHPY